MFDKFKKFTLSLPLYVKSDYEEFFNDLFKKYPPDFVSDAIITYLKEKKHIDKLQYSYRIDSLNEDDKRWLIDYIESAIEAEIAAAEAEAEARAIAEAEAAMFEQMMMEEEPGFDGPYDY